ncbi:dihydroorotate dehydrogenase electron transfer subunit [Candidatus Soleaferrea massiliensis]|uniref:dihydroorotate dehydrogenase electron transfer subunit n=1 Tax=Candidatus Soleaferrea massiliensis TaxID=1470354 RepID=UPI00058B1A92|nr:dihydroorotate dehydrogenase electron transfer subunit [Candidatus Soleaferrea massiliensis]
MSYQQGLYPIIEKTAIAKNTYSFTILAQEIAEMAKPGQFVHVKCKGYFLRRPISICEIDRKKGTLRIVFEIRGEGTEALSHLNVGDVVDMLAPLGNGFDILEPDKKAVVIGGGIGVPPMLEVAKQYQNPMAILGFRSASAVILEQDFKQYGRAAVSTDDGSYGRRGFVSDILNDYLKEETPDIIYACGPAPMLKVLKQIAKEHGVRLQVSLEERMGCGIGACLVCACRTKKDGKESMSHVCKDGPVFEAEEVQF